MSTASNGWAAVPGGVGSVLAVAGDVRVAAEISRLRAWRGLVPLWLAEAPEQNPARPTILADRVCWGPYAADLDTGALTEIPFARPPQGYLATAHAWSPDGSAAVAAGRRRDPGGSAPAVAAWRLDPSTAQMTADPGTLIGRSARKSLDGFGTGRSPLEVISNTPSSLTAPNRFLTARTTRCE